MIAVGYTIVLDVTPLSGAGRWLEAVAELSMAGLAHGAGNFLFVALLKWMPLYRCQKRNAPMWTTFVWLSEAVTNLYEGIAVPNFMRFLRGTPWRPPALNLQGTRIGRGVYMDTTDITGQALQTTLFRYAVAATCRATAGTGNAAAAHVPPEPRDGRNLHAGHGACRACASPPATANWTRR